MTRGFLAELLMADCDDRARRRSGRRIKAAATIDREQAAHPALDVIPEIVAAAVAE